MLLPSHMECCRKSKLHHGVVTREISRGTKILQTGILLTGSDRYVVPALQTHSNFAELYVSSCPISPGSPWKDLLRAPLFQPRQSEDRDPSCGSLLLS